MINNIRNNTISEISAKKDLNTINEINKAGITKQKKRTPKQKELLNLFKDFSDTTLNDKVLMSSKDKNEKENENEKEKKNGNEETLMSSKNDVGNENEDDKTIMSSNEDDDDGNEKMNQNEKKKKKS